MRRLLAAVVVLRTSKYEVDQLKKGATRRTDAVQSFPYTFGGFEFGKTFGQIHFAQNDFVHDSWSCRLLISFEI